MVILAVLCLAIGLYPRAVYAPLKAAAAVVQTITNSETVAEQGDPLYAKLRSPASLAR